MIDLKYFREHSTDIQTAAKNKGVTIDVERILDLDRRVRSLTGEIESIKAQKNAASGAIAKASPEDRKTMIAEMQIIDRKSEALQEELSPLEEELRNLVSRIPNPALPDVRIGVSDEENVVLRTCGDIPKFDFEPKDHQTIGEALGIIDMKRGAKVSGARFFYFVGDGARLERALINYGLDVALKHGFIPVSVPNLVSAHAMGAMGYLEHGGTDEIYFLPKDSLYLIGTAEQAIGPMYMDEILDEDTLPIRHVAASPCYRRESGSAGKDTKGIIRVHQFTKVELFSFCKPQESEKEHERMLAIEEELLAALGLPYHVLDIVTGDLGLPAAKKWDTEVWFPAQNRYREVTSTSNCTDFQARRLSTRFRNAEGAVEHVHTVNGTAFSGRPIAAILENFQNADGSVTIPEVLRPYMGGQTAIVRK
jgi:seryl-tRNA synthetase